MEQFRVERLLEMDFEKVVKIANKTFSGLNDFEYAKLWVNYNSISLPGHWQIPHFFVLICTNEEDVNVSPVTEYSNVKPNEKIVGYIIWLHEGGLRDGNIIELKQIVIEESYRDKKVGKILTKESFLEMQRYFHARGHWIKIVKVTTGSKNIPAIKLYENALGAKIEATLRDYYGEEKDEVIMIARFNKG